MVLIPYLLPAISYLKQKLHRVHSKIPKKFDETKVRTSKPQKSALPKVPFHDSQELMKAAVESVGEFENDHDRNPVVKAADF